jgi:WD40 repeat protein
MQQIPDAHMSGSITSGICCTRDATKVATRGGDDTVKLWDLRFTKKEISQLATTGTTLPNASDDTGIIFSPDESMVVTGRLLVLSPGVLL